MSAYVQGLPYMYPYILVFLVIRTSGIEIKTLLSTSNREAFEKPALKSKTSCCRAVAALLALPDGKDCRDG